jgi:hypothetical protein
MQAQFVHVSERPLFAIVRVVVGVVEKFALWIPHNFSHYPSPLRCGPRWSKEHARSASGGPCDPPKGARAASSCQAHAYDPPGTPHARFVANAFVTLGHFY